VEDALRGATRDLARAIEIVTESLRNHGRLFYVGAAVAGALVSSMRAKFRRLLARHPILCRE
jgi:N-acetylmuramic acid 6-phosphate (MurNAc-6-P) etherase